jgi:DNA-binding ferritin-like protein
VTNTQNERSELTRVRHRAADPAPSIGDGANLSFRHTQATVAHESHLPAVDDHLRAEAGRDLQATLVELIDLSLLGKQLHWNIVGRPFKPLHEHLDELVDSWRELSDTIAERAVALGVPPDGQAAAVTAGSGLAPVAGGVVDTDSCSK